MRFLLVEDEKKVANFVARGLRAERYAVDIAYDGTTGWELASRTNYDLIILDIMLPGLNGTEFALLEYLASHPGRVLALTMIVEHVWDESFEGLTNIVDVYVRHLREKVDDPFPTRIIRTVRGVGYSLSESEDPT